MRLYLIFSRTIFLPLIDYILYVFNLVGEGGESTLVIAAFNDLRVPYDIFVKEARRPSYFIEFKLIRKGLLDRQSRLVPIPFPVVDIPCPHDEDCLCDLCDRDGTKGFFCSLVPVEEELLDLQSEFLT